MHLHRYHYIFVIIAYAVAILTHTQLASFVGNVIVLQQFVSLARLALQKLPGDQQVFSTIISALSGINFDIRLVEPGCLVGTLSFLSYFWLTIALVCIAATMFTLGAIQSTCNTSTTTTYETS